MLDLSKRGAALLTDQGARGCLHGALAAVLLGVLTVHSGGAEECSQDFESTYDLIQEAVFEKKGCTSSSCHGASAAGGLDLSADVSYENLIGVPATTVPEGRITGLRRVVPGQKDESLLFLNLAAATLPAEFEAPLRAMPLGLEALSLDELEALREWIEQGAPREGTVPGTGELLDACLPPAKPNPIEPLAAPESGSGVQIVMPPWVVPGNSETEVCFVSYYDVSDKIPERYLDPSRQSFYWNQNQVRQDPLSHHLIVDYYFGSAPLDESTWGEFLCRGGDHEGQPCGPMDLGGCGDGICASEPQAAVACAGFGPADLEQATFQFSGTQEASSLYAYAQDVYATLPVRGTVVWNSHAFNVTDEDGSLRGWLNFGFAQPDERVHFVSAINNDEQIYKMNVPPFAAQEICHHHVFPPDTRLFELNSHTHRRGKRFTVYDGRYACADGPSAGEPCSPEPETALTNSDICVGTECVRLVPPESGDCNDDGAVGIEDLVRCVNIALGKVPVSACPTADPDASGGVSVAELISAVGTSLNGTAVDRSEPELLYVSLNYSDPAIVRFDPPREYPGATAPAAARTLTFCGLYDNGALNPSEVKTRASSPPNPYGIPGYFGGPCVTPESRTEGLVGELCQGATEEERNASCDTAVGARDGFCDGCVLTGGVTTEDEMFILNGYYFVDQRHAEAPR